MFGVGAAGIHLGMAAEGAGSWSWHGSGPGNPSFGHWELGFKRGTWGTPNLG